MSEENKTVELKDEELKQVTGGVKFVITEVDVGDVFKLSSMTIVIKNHVVDDGLNPKVSVIIVELKNNSWVKKRDETLYFSEIKNYWTYSFELSQKLNHLLN